MSEWERLSSEIIFEHPYLKIGEDRVRLPDGKEIDYITFLDRPDFVTIIPILPSGKILMTKEHAYPINEPILQFSEGECDSGESVEHASEREFFEETGYKADEFKLIGSVLTYHRRSEAMQRVVVATGVSWHSEPRGDGIEQGIETLEMTDKEISSAVAKGVIFQANALAAWSVYKAVISESNA